MDDDSWSSPYLPMCKLATTMSSADWISEARALLAEPSIPDSVKQQVRQLWLTRLQETGVVPDVFPISPSPAPQQFTPEGHYTALADKEFDAGELRRLVLSYMAPNKKVKHVWQPSRTRYGPPSSTTTYTRTPGPMYQHSGLANRLVQLGLESLEDDMLQKVQDSTYEVQKEVRSRLRTNLLQVHSKRCLRCKAGLC